MSDDWTDWFGDLYAQVIDPVRYVDLGNDRLIGFQQDGTLSGSVWDAAIVMSEFLYSYYELTDLSEKRVIELGSGTGVVGITMAYLSPAEVVLTDLDLQIPNLLDNVENHRADLGAVSITAKELCWGKDLPDKFDIVIACDVVYGVIGDDRIESDIEANLDNLIETLALASTVDTELWVGMERRRINSTRDFETEFLSKLPIVGFTVECVFRKQFGGETASSSANYIEVYKLSLS